MNRSFSQIFGIQPRVRASAPGRIEFIGNHTDYNGGLVMGVALDIGITAEAALRNDHRLRLYSMHEDSTEIVELSVDSLMRQEGKNAWANYPVGVLVMLKEHGMQLQHGFDIHISGNIPTGAGLSSSAALELATAMAVVTLCNYEISRADLARVCRRAENEFVGVPCGILDQGVSAFGKEDHLVRIDCQTEAFSTLPLPHGLRFWIFNTRQKHSLIESLYATRFEECHQALRILRENGVETINLASVDPEIIRSCSALPEMVRKRALHVSEEHRRVQSMSKALEEGDLEKVGELLYASHNSSRTLFENSTEQIDALVDILKGRNGIIGARLTGGGFGGAAMALATSDFTQKDAEDAAAAFEQRFPEMHPNLFHAQSGDGASAELL